MKFSRKGNKISWNNIFFLLFFPPFRIYSLRDFPYIFQLYLYSIFEWNYLYSTSLTGKYLTRSAFQMRRHYFNDEEVGYFLTQKRTAPASNPMTDPSMMTEMLKGNLTNVLPMIVIGGWINWMFSGFVTTKVPFPLTLRFKPMLQRGKRFDSQISMSIRSSYKFPLIYS